jgi:DNA-binding winged helix-turn-helix (wHTH) protein
MGSQLIPVRPLEGQKVTDSPAAAPARYVCFGPFHLDLQKDELFKDGTRVKLQGKVYQALLALLQKPGEIVTREELRSQLWPADSHVNYDANVNTTVNKLRQILSDSPDQPTFVETIPRKGYSFVAKVRFADRMITPPPRHSESALVTGVEHQPEARPSFFPATLHSPWLTAGVLSLIIASMLFGAALALYAHH